MLRRQTLKLLAGAAFSAEPNIRWALGAVSWVVKAGKDSPDWADILEDIRAAGFEGFEPYTAPTLPVNDANIARLEELAPRYGLRMSGIYWGDEFHLPASRDGLIQESHRFLGYLKRFGADRLLIGPPDAEVDNEREAIGEMARTLNAIGRIASTQYGVKIGVHPHGGSLIENPRQIERLLEETDPRYFHFAPDTMQIWVGGGDPVGMIGKYRDRLAYLHYKDSRPYRRAFRTPADFGVELGRGVIDFPAIHRILRSIRYRGWIAIDVAKTTGSPLESARINRSYIDRVLAPIYR